jgi:Domain of unknown function (DUF397)
MKLYELSRSRRLVWRRASACAGGECAEVARTDDMIVLRSSLAPRRVIKYTPEEFRALRLGMQAGEFDDLA